MNKTHFKKDGSGYVDERSRQIAEEVTARKNASKQIVASGDGVFEGEGEGEGEDVNKIFLDVVGVKKQRVYGVGTLASSITSRRQYVPTSSSSLTENETLRAEVQSLKDGLIEERTTRTRLLEQAMEQAKEEMKEKMKEEMKAEMAAAKEEMKAEMMKTLLEELRRQPPS